MPNSDLISIKSPFIAALRGITSYRIHSGSRLLPCDRKVHVSDLLGSHYRHILLAYTGLSYTRSQAIRVSNTFLFMGRGAVFFGWILFTISMASVSVGALGVLGMPVLHQSFELIDSRRILGA